MDLDKVLAELRRELEDVEEAIIALERLARGPGKRRGRPPKWIADLGAQPPAPPARKRGRRSKSNKGL